MRDIKGYFLASLQGLGPFFPQSPFLEILIFSLLLLLVIIILIFLLPLLLLPSLSIFKLLSCPSSFSCFPFYFSVVLSSFAFCFLLFLFLNFIIFKSLPQTSLFQSLLFIVSCFSCFIVFVSCCCCFVIPLICPS